MTYWKCACIKCGSRKEVAALGARGLRNAASSRARVVGCVVGKSEAPDEGEEAAE
jgi:hypothetical protein